MKSFYIFILIILLLAVSPGRIRGQARTGPTVKRVPGEEPTGQDFVRFTNGDVLTGQVEGIADRAVMMIPEMGDNSLDVPVGAIKEVVFKDDERGQSFPGDRVILVNGESLVARVESLEDEKLSLHLPSPQRVEMDLDKVAAIAFYKREVVLAEEEFEGELPTTMTFQKGRWRTQTGWLLQSDSRATECLASLPLTQTGTMVYEWTVNTTIGRSTGLYFMASDPGLSQEQGYFVRVLRKYVYIYVCTNREEVYCGSYRTSLHKNRNEVKLQYDSYRGFIEVWIDGTQVGRWHSSAPITLGKYVVLRADGRAAFDNLRALQKGGAAKPDVRNSQEKGDFLRLVNGDRIAAEAKGISEDCVSYNFDENETALEIERETLSYVRFDREIRDLPLGVAGTVVLVTHSGDRISGELVFLKDGVARITSELISTIDVRRMDLRKVIFQEVP